MTLRELFGLVAPAKLEQIDESLAFAEALHDAEGSEAPLLVRMFSAIGTWIGAALIALVLSIMEIYEVAPLALLLAAGLFGAAVVWSRQPRRSLVVSQLIWAMTLGAHGLVAGALTELGLVDVDDVTLAATWAGLNVATIFLVRVPSLQLVSAVSAVGVACWWASMINLPLYPLWVGVPAAALATAVWILELPLATRLGRSWTALAYGLPIGALIPLTMLGINDDELGLTDLGFGAPLASAAMLALIGVVLWQARREQSGAIEARSYALGVIVLLVGVATHRVPGLSLSLLWLLVAHLRKSAGLQTIASIQLGCFLFFFYYQLETTLLLKSLWVISTGALLLLGAWLARPRSQAAGAHEAPARRSRWLPAIVLALLTSAMVIGASVQKQRVLAEGQTVLLPLAPVDPRSLMQGDYMVLRYALENEISRARPIIEATAPIDAPELPPPDQGFEPPESFDWIEPFEPGDLPRHGRLVIAVNDEGVGHFARFDDGSPLAADELYLEYRLRDDLGDSLRVGAESFLFEEGSAELYADAKYGELVVASDGESVLVGLRDQQRAPLGERLHPR